MQTLLPAIREALQVMPQLNRRGDCYITPHQNYMPTGTRQPCIGIKDGGISRVELGGEMLELTARVDLVGFVKMTGDGEAAVLEVYQLLDDATEILNNNYLGLADMMRLQLGPDRQTELFQADNKQWIVKLVRALVYTLERPSV